jgi:hypothetical protein
MERRSSCSCGLRHGRRRRSKTRGSGTTRDDGGNGGRLGLLGEIEMDLGLGWALAQKMIASHLIQEAPVGSSQTHRANPI